MATKKKTTAKKSADVKVSTGDKGFNLEAKEKNPHQGRGVYRKGGDAKVISKANKKIRGQKEAAATEKDYNLSGLSAEEIDRLNSERASDAGRGSAAARADADKAGVRVTPSQSKRAENEAVKALDDWESDRKAKQKALDAERDAPFSRPTATPGQAAQLNSAVRGAGADETKKAQIFNKVNKVNYGADHHMPCTTEGCRNLVPSAFGDSACPSCSAADDAKWAAWDKKYGTSSSPTKKYTSDTVGSVAAKFSDRS